MISRVIRVDEVRICSILWVFVRCELEIFFNMSVVSGLPPTIYSLPCRSIKAGNGGIRMGTPCWARQCVTPESSNNPEVALTFLAPYQP